MEFINYWKDTLVPDDRDYTCEMLFGYAEELPSYVLLSNNEIQNQRYEDPYGCVFYSSSDSSNTMNFFEKSWIKITGHELCKIAIEKWVLDVNAWAYWEDWPKLLRELWYISYYGRCRSLEDIKLSLHNKRPVVTGSNTIDWNKSLQNNFTAIYGLNYGHFFTIMWYDDSKQRLICENSYWKDEWDNGYFYINYSDYSLLYNSKFTMNDTLNPNVIRDAITIEDAKLFFDRWYTSWTNPTAPITRQECFALLERVMKANNLK